MTFAPDMKIKTYNKVDKIIANIPGDIDEISEKINNN